VVSSLASARAEVAEQAIPNVQVSHDRFPDHAEPSVAVNPRNPRNLLGSAMLIRPHTLRVGTFVSFDTGRTWHDNGPLPMPVGMDYTGDTTSVFDSRGVGFVSAVIAKISDNGMHISQQTGVYVWRTDDSGRIFHGPVPVVLGQATDHPSLAVAPDTGTLYVAWRSKSPDGLAFSRSTDGGRQFSAPRLIFRSPEQLASVPIVAAGPGGAVSIACELDFGQPWNRVLVFRSTDGGRTFHRSTVGRASLTVTPSSHILIPSPVSIAIDPHDGSVYTTYSAYQPGNPRPGILVARSRDRGRTWTAPVLVPAGSGTRGVAPFQPRVAVDDQGGLAVSFSVLSHGQVDEFLTYSTSHGSHFPAPRRITTRSFNPSLGIREGGKTGAWWIGDYQGLAAGRGRIYPFWNDTRTGHLEIFTAVVPVSAVR
jgi:hypothetical protein